MSRPESTVSARDGSRIGNPRLPGQRVFLASALVNNVGTGMYLVGGTVYFDRVVGLSPAQIGSGLGMSALVRLAVTVPAGRWADRNRPQLLYAASMAAGAVGMLLFLAVDSYLPFVLVSCLAGTVSGANQSIRSMLVRAYGGTSLVRMRSSVVAATNLGISIGAVLGGVALSSNSEFSYRCLIVGNAVSFLVAAALCLRLQEVKVEPNALGPRHAVLRDRRFLAVTVLNAVYSLHFSLLTFVLPLWVIGFTTAPRWVTTAAFLLNTLMIVALQVPVGTRVSTARGAGIAYSCTGLSACAGLVLLGLGGHTTGGLTLPVILVGVVALTCAELTQSAGSMQLLYQLSPRDRQGEYSGMFLLGQGLAQAAAPYILATVCLTKDMSDWLACGAAFLVLSAAAPHVLRFLIRDSEIR